MIKISGTNNVNVDIENSFSVISSETTAIKKIDIKYRNMSKDRDW